jgi:hypothetical protein
MGRRYLTWILAGACVASVAIAYVVMSQPEPAAKAKPDPAPGRQASHASGVEYNRDILPILSSKCFTCHGPDVKKAGLRLDRREFATRPAKSGDTPIVPGKSADSEVVRRIFADDEAERMPPRKGGKPLTDAEKQLIKRWIEQGAEYREHWAFVPVERPAVPAVKDRAWGKNAIDGLVLHRLEEAGLQPSPAAERATLIRRLSLDLRGLPPSLAEVDEFLADQSPDAYEKLVERMLASPHYGEKMAVLWLDLARFGDTSGYHMDSTRQMWLWRDWVVNAFNRDMPFDQFTIEQLAGDLAPNATDQQKIASGFNRNTRFNEEGGVDPEEYVIRYNIDRTNTLGQVWLGLTLGCAECHSHKYDPISQREYYQLFAYFTGIKEPMLSGPDAHGKPLPPVLKVPTPEQAKQLADLGKMVPIIEHAIGKQLERYSYTDPLEGKAVPADPPAELVARSQLAWEAKVNPVDWAEKKHAFELSGKKWEEVFQWLAAESKLPYVTVYKTPTGRVRFADLKDAKYSLAEIYDVVNDRLIKQEKFVLVRTNVSLSLYPADGKMWPIPQVSVDQLRQRGATEIVEVVVSLRGDLKAKEVAAEVKRALGDFGHVAALEKSNKIVVRGDVAALRRVLPEFCAMPEPVGEKSALDELPATVREALKIERGKRTDAQKKTVRGHYLRRVNAEARETLDPLERDLDDHVKKIRAINDAVPHTLVSQEMETPRPADVLIRGDFLHRGEKVERSVPAAFGPLPTDAPNNRLGLARWLVRADNPLTARVTVNRLWAQMFGHGIVRSIGDFGTQGDFPSHPELLDWLASEFVHPSSGPGDAWKIKRIVRLIALSATYRQSAAIPAAAAKADPHNRLLSHMPRYRLSAEELRDGALAMAGILNRKVGGPSFMPYQPPDYYKNKNEDWPWAASPGDEQYRRGLYAFWRRTALHPMFAILDAPNREECTVARPRTNTPLQALVTLNDPTFVEAARVLAQRVLTGPKDLDDRLTFAFRTATCRRPTAAELKVVRAEHLKQLARFQADPEAASKLVNAGQYPRDAALDVAELAAWTATANMLMNLDEVLTRE